MVLEVGGLESSITEAHSSTAASLRPQTIKGVEDYKVSVFYISISRTGGQRRGRIGDLNCYVQNTTDLFSSLLVSYIRFRNHKATTQLLVEELERGVAVLNGAPSSGVSVSVAVSFVRPQRVEEHILGTLDKSIQRRMSHRETQCVPDSEDRGSYVSFQGE